ncbi:HD-GYP domain-containing protein [Devosia nitrariae]|uniref:Phosphohydrolase n=1 Tax=Devosia nitrariae TaxID=2071872 RepID=A0ABQ5W612_9HYPH|nr:HD domain-containing phosphohydrolase [Devosia nitrariae]GLQ55365.1 phosphohydrolase [Devosia nitrariae]
MLLITDREDQSSDLAGKLQLLGGCRVAPLQSLASRPPADDLVICDVSLDNVAVALQLKTTLPFYCRQQVPMLFLLDENSHHQATQAWALGAREVAARAMPVRPLLMLVRSLLPDRLERGAFDANLEQAALAIADMLDAQYSGTSLQTAQLLAGCHAVLEALEEGGIHQWMTKVSQYDHSTYQHCLLVAGFAGAFAIELGFSRSDRTFLTMAAFVHDVGKALIPLEILDKPDYLTDEEMRIIKRHPELGKSLLLTQGTPSAELLDVVLHHHELPDATGYPHGLGGADIADPVRLMTIFDIFSALVERRAYKPSMTAETAYLKLLQMGGKLDRDFVRAFRKVVVNAGQGTGTPPAARAAR